MILTQEGQAYQAASTVFLIFQLSAAIRCIIPHAIASKIVYYIMHDVPMLSKTDTLRPERIKDDVSCPNDDAVHEGSVRDLRATLRDFNVRRRVGSAAVDLTEQKSLYQTHHRWL